MAVGLRWPLECRVRIPNGGRQSRPAHGLHPHFRQRTRTSRDAHKRRDWGPIMTRNEWIRHLRNARRKCHHTGTLRDRLNIVIADMLDGAPNEDLPPYTVLAHRASTALRCAAQAERRQP